MKTSLFKKIIALTLTLTLIMSCMMIAAPYVHAADSIDFLMDGNKRAGIKQITIDGITYYDIDGGKSTVDPTEITPVELYKKAMTADYNGYSAVDMWANVASLIFESAGTDFGYNDDGFSSTFDDYFTDDTNNNKDINLITELAASDSSHNTGHKHGRARTTGWTVATDLKAAQSKMISEVSASFSGDSKEGVNTSDVLKYSTGSSNGFNLLNNTDRRDVLYNIVTSSNYNGGSNRASYTSFGMVFYDFELIPLTDDDLEFITAAEGYDSLEAAEEANAPGVEYNDTGSGSPHTSYVTNPSSSDSTVSASYSETHSTTVSNYMESSETYTFGQSTEVSTEFSASFPLVTDARTSISVGFTSEQAISTAYGEEKSVTKETTTETVAEVNLPAHTQMGITQQTGTTEIVFNYDCPVYLTYKAAVFAMNGEFYLDSLTVERWGDSGYDTGGMCVGFSTDNSTGGLTAVDNLYNRAVRSANMEGFEASYGNCEGYWEMEGDGGSSRKYTEVSWSSFINNKQRNGADLTAKECVVKLRNNIPLSAAGGKMSVMSTSMSTDITSIMPLYDLDYVQADGSGVYTIAPGGNIDFSKIATVGYNEYNVPYYGYISDGGSWVLCDADGNELTAVDGVTLTDVGNYQKLTAEKVGTYYAKFLIDETLYSKVDGSGKIANADLSSTAIVTINVTETGLDHICTEGPWQTTVAATCTTEGEQHANCVTCGRVMYTQTVAKIDHIPVTITTPATCQSEGKITEMCGACLGLISSTTTPKLEHVAGEWVTTTEAGCVLDGEKQQTCVDCGTLLAVEAIEAHGHSDAWVTVKEATCEEAGREERTCSICKWTLETREIAKGEHTPGDWEILSEATCELDGEKQQTCSGCGALLASETIEAHGHAEAWITVKEASCQAVGREEKVCTICKAVLETREIAKTEHTPGKWEITKDSTCTQSGLMQQTCAHCGALIGEPVVIDAHEHDEGAWVTVLEATCTTNGEKVRECTICKGTLEAEVIPALGHDEGVWVTSLEATCETPGEQHKTCTRCGTLIDSQRIDALGHTPGPAMTCVTDQVCLVCEEVLVSADGKSHVWTEWETYKEASFFVEEQQRRVCTSCDLEEYRFVKGTSGCHKYFPHCDGSGEDCWACETLSNTNGFFRNLGKFLTWFFFENIITTILFPFAHGHFHEMINLSEIFGS